MKQKPAISISREDYLALWRLIESGQEDFITEQLAEELERADIVPAEKFPRNVVAVGSTVTFTVESTGKTFAYQLVYPAELDNSGNKLSVLSPVGSAIIGLKEGQHIDWIINRDQKNLEHKTVIHVNKVRAATPTEG